MTHRTTLLFALALPSLAMIAPVARGQDVRQADGTAAGVLAADVRVGLPLPPGLWAIGLRTQPGLPVALAAYVAAGLTLGCDGCSLAGVEVTKALRGDTVYVSAGVAHLHAGAGGGSPPFPRFGGSHLLVPFTGGGLWRFGGVDLRAGGGLYLLASTHDYLCTFDCNRRAPTLLPYLELVSSFWLL